MSNGNDPPQATRQMAHDMIAAAYASMVTGNTTVPQAIRTELEWQTTRPTLYFADRILYPFNYYDDMPPLFFLAIWVKDLILAYDIVKAMGYPSAVFEQWCLDLSEVCEQIVHENMSRRFPARKENDYANRTSWSTTDLRPVHRLADGTVISVPTITLMFNNRRSNLVGLYGMAGALTGNQFYIDEFERYMKELVMFAGRLSPYGWLTDPERGVDSFPQLGYSYTMHAMEGLLPAMEALARQGNTELYDFSSSDGATQPTWGTNHFKTMEQVLDALLKWVSKGWTAQYTGSGEPPSTSVAGDEFYRVQSRTTHTNREIIGDGNFLYAANYYNRSDWVDIIMRQGTPTGFTSAVHNTGAIFGWRNDYRTRFLRSLTANPYGGS